MRLLPFACLLVLSCLSSCTAETEAGEGGSLSAEDELLLQGVEDTANTFEDEDWGEGLRVLVTYRPENCEHRAKTDDVIHYHYVGRLGSDGKEFGKSFDYDSPYIVSLGQGRIIAGMDRGLMGTCLWERRRITIPPHLGYGKRGVGETIPPNSVLVFYIRMIKIERNGFGLGEDEKFEDIWQTGLYSYTDKKWNQTIDMIEESIRMYNLYENQTLHCLRECVGAGDLSKTQQEVVGKYTGGDDPLINQFLVYAAKGKCVRECKAKMLRPNMRYPDPKVVREFRNRKPYSYLHFAYYQLENYVEGAKCCFTFHHYNPTDQLALNSLPFYRDQLGLEDNQFVFREPGISPSQAAFLAGKGAYNKEVWLEAADHFERALDLYKAELSDCQLLCEDVFTVNLTQPDMNEQKREHFEEYSLVPDSMEYYQLMATLIKDVLECRVGCMDRVATMEGQLADNYVTLIFNYLQYSYFKLNQFKKAAECASTFVSLDPSEQIMAQNIHFYKTQHKVPNEFFVPREEYVSLNKKCETEKRLIHYGKFGHIKKRSGQRGDRAEIELPARHSEL